MILFTIGLTDLNQVITTMVVTGEVPMETEFLMILKQTVKAKDRLRPPKMWQMT